MVTLPASTYVVLGLLARKPGSGYDVAAFAERSARFFWPISRSQLYSELSRLEELGWATGTAVKQDRYPDKRVYEPTPAGMQALRDWLETPNTGRTQRTGQRKGQRTQDIVLRTFLGSYMSQRRLGEQLQDYRVHAEHQHAALSAVMDRIDARGLDYPRALARATARYGVMQAEATIAWTKEVEALLERHSDETA